jgi:hypothetical protein
MRLNVPILSGIKAVALLHRQTPALNTSLSHTTQADARSQHPLRGGLAYLDQSAFSFFGPGFGSGHSSGMGGVCCPFAFVFVFLLLCTLNA